MLVITVEVNGAVLRRPSSPSTPLAHFDRCDDLLRLSLSGRLRRVPSLPSLRAPASSSFGLRRRNEAGIRSRDVSSSSSQSVSSAWDAEEGELLMGDLVPGRSEGRPTSSLEVGHLRWKLAMCAEQLHVFCLARSRSGGVALLSRLAASPPSRTPSSPVPSPMSQVSLFNFPYRLSLYTCDSIEQVPRSGRSHASSLHECAPSS